MHTDKYAGFFSHIQKNQNQLEKLILRAAKEKNRKKQILLAQDAADFAASRGTGIYSSDILEKIFLKAAQENHIKQAPDFKKDSFLHVLTECYGLGGHTRIVERWIELSPAGQNHSVILLKQKDAPPATLLKNVRMRNGSVFLADKEKSPFLQAMELRRKASEFQYIVLHIHPNDTLPLIAFGTEEFKRPVLLINHSDHIFWTGISIADIVLNLGSVSDSICREKRRAGRTEIIGIPADPETAALPGKKEAREKTGLPADEKIILTAGSPAKFKPIGTSSMIVFLEELGKTPVQALCFVIGADPADPHWKKAVQESGGKIKILPRMDYDKGFLTYLAAADLVLDSYPIGGGTTVIDAVLAGKPVLSLQKGLPQSDYMMNSQSYCLSGQELVSKAVRILNDSNYAQKMHRELYEKLMEEHSSEKWAEKIKNILKHLPAKHYVYPFDSSKAPKTITDMDVLASVWAEKYFSAPFSLKRIFQKFRRFLFRFRWQKNQKILKICGIYFIRK